MNLYTTTWGKGGFVITVGQSHIHFFIEMLFQWCIFCLINKVLIQNAYIYFIRSKWLFLRSTQLTSLLADLHLPSGYLRSFIYIWCGTMPYLTTTLYIFLHPPTPLFPFVLNHSCLCSFYSLHGFIAALVQASRTWFTLLHGRNGRVRFYVKQYS